MSSSAQTPDRGRRRRLLVAVVVGLAAMTVTIGLGWAGAGRESSGSIVRWGWPLVWATQDQSALSPPGAASSAVRLLSPWEHPTRVDGGSLVLDAALVGGCLLGIVGVGVLVRQQPTRRQ